MGLSKLQVQVRPDQPPRVMLMGLDITAEVLGMQINWEVGKAPVAQIAVAVQGADVDIFAETSKTVAGVAGMTAGPPAQEAAPPGDTPPPATGGTPTP